jgi:hypothetical protein
MYSYRWKSAKLAKREEESSSASRNDKANMIGDWFHGVCAEMRDHTIRVHQN